ncbi:MAG: hypothetical protein K6E37_02610 [Bacteroidales bacterium]|nr:hypothetical protein [Bacteroidales bacterium]
MKTNIKLLSALIAMAFVAMPLSAQQSARRNGSDAANRQEVKVERQQTKVDKVQKPTNISNQNATDRKVRDAGISSGSVNGGSSFGSNSGSASNSFGGNGKGGSVSNDGARRPSGGSMNNGSSSNHGSVNSGYSGKVNHGGSVNNGGNHGNSGSHNNGGSVNNRPPQGGNSGNHGGSVNNGGNHNNGNHNNGGSMNKPQGGGAVNHGGSVNHGASKKPDHGGHVEHHRRPAMPTVKVYTRPQVYERTNSNSIVVNTLFSSKAEAYDYIATLLDARYYTIASYGNNYNWLKTEVAFIPTPFDWTNPMTHNQFRMEFDITRSLFGTVKVTITAYWRESVLSTGFTRLRFQPSDRYSTYYAWRVLEDIASNIPNSSVYYN